MRGRHYLICLVCAAAGTVIGRCAPGRAVLTVLAATASLAAALTLSRSRHSRLVVLPAVVLCVWAVLGSLQFAGIRNGLLPRLARGRPVVEMSGRLVSPPETRGERTTFFIEAGRLSVGDRTYACGERARVRVTGRLPDSIYYPGVHVRARGGLRAAGADAGWLMDRGAAASLDVQQRDISVARPADPVSAMVDRARRWVSRRYSRLFDPRTAGLMEGVTLSRLERLDRGTEADLRSCGLSHIVAVSGLHVGSTAMLVLVSGTAFGLGRRSRYALASLAAFSVVCVSNFRPSATRAAIMAAAGYGGYVSGRRYDGLTGLSLAGLTILAANPRSLFDLGFQYSFAAAGGIVLAMGWTASKRAGAAHSGGPEHPFLAVCAGAQLGILPLLLARGDAVPLTAVVANLLVVPAVGPLLLSGWAAAAACSLGGWAGGTLALFPRTLASYVMKVSALLAFVPKAGATRSLGAAIPLVLYVAGLALMLRAAARGRGTLRAATALGLALAIALFSCVPAVPYGRADSVTFLDVGQGDAILARVSPGACALVDGGPDPRLLVKKLEERRVTRIDLVVLTHPHADHLAGLVEAVRRFPVGTLLEPGLPRSSPLYREFLELAESRGIKRVTAREGQVIALPGGMSLEVLRAPADLDALPEDLNDCSVVLALDLKGMEVLLTGDAGARAQEEMLSAHPGVRCDVLKVAHQGAREAASEPLFDRCAPAVAAISVGESNQYGHPSRECLELLNARGIEVARTDLHGDIEVSVSNGRIGLATGRR